MHHGELPLNLTSFDLEEIFVSYIISSINHELDFIIFKVFAFSIV